VPGVHGFTKMMRVHMMTLLGTQLANVHLCCIVISVFESHMLTPPVACSLPAVLCFGMMRVHITVTCSNRCRPVLGSSCIGGHTDPVAHMKMIAFGIDLYIAPGKQLYWRSHSRRYLACENDDLWYSPVACSLPAVSFLLASRWQEHMLTCLMFLFSVRSEPSCQQKRKAARAQGLPTCGLQSACCSLLEHYHGMCT
jgi:hypothetical protein